MENLKKLSPKLTIVDLPNDFDKTKFVENLGEKDDNLKKMIGNSNNIEIIGCWEMKDESGRVRSKKLAVKVTSNIRNYLMHRNAGYVYLNLSRYRVYDCFNVLINLIVLIN